MKVTFMIGNGFDLRLGLNTRYVDMYDSYVEQDSTSPVIEKFKKLLKEDAPNGYATWGDFEIAMGRHAGIFNTEDDLILCNRHFKNHMATHLLGEQNQFFNLCRNANVGNAVANQMEQSLRYFYVGLIPNVVHTLEELDSGVFAYLGTITFNYTTTFDKAFTYLDKRNDPFFSGAPIIHVHGSLDSDVVLGVDNPSQIINPPYSVSNKLARAFIKPFFNSQFDEKRISDAKQLITNSNVVCIYGMSLGQSDQMWIDYICDWLCENPSHHLVYFRYSEQKFSPWMRDLSMDQEDSEKTKLLTKICGNASCRDELVQSLFAQVHIPINNDIFDLRFFIDKARQAKPRPSMSIIGSVP